MNLETFSQLRFSYRRRSAGPAFLYFLPEFELILLPCARPAVINPVMDQNNGISDHPKEGLDIARGLRRFVAEQLAAGRPVVLDSVHEFLDDKFPNWPIEARRLIARSEFDRLKQAAVVPGE